MSKVKFPFNHNEINTAEDFRRRTAQLGYTIPVSSDLTPLRQTVSLHGRRISNAMAIQPLEGMDAEEPGAPSSLTLARYERLAAQGAGIVWVEATAICPEGRSGPRQLWIHSGSLEGFRQLTQTIDQSAQQAGHAAPFKILQLTHSGRSSKDAAGNPAPLAAFNSPYLDSVMGMPQIVSDAYLDALQVQMGTAAAYAWEAGFDAVELKLCHQYLFHELLSAYTRPGKYGGSQENRFRFALGALEEIRAQAGSRLEVAVRLNAYDAIPWPYGWGMASVPLAPHSGVTSSWQGNHALGKLSRREQSNWAGNESPLRISDVERSNWQGNPQTLQSLPAQRSNWQGNHAFDVISARQQSNWSGNPSPLQISQQERSSWQGNPVVWEIAGTTATNWQGNPVLHPTGREAAAVVDGALEGPMQTDLTEVKELMRQLYDRGIRLFNLSTTSPRFAPEGKGYLNNFDPAAQVDPYAGVSALLQATRALRQVMPRDMQIVGTGLGWFGPFSANVAAGGVREGWFDIAGFGRSVMADDGFIAAILRGSQPDPASACIGCDSCLRLLGAGLPAGCPVQHAAYQPLIRYLEQQACGTGIV